MDQTEHEEHMWKHYKEIENENFRLKNQLRQVIKENKELKRRYNNLLRKYKKQKENRKPRYRNNGKAGK